jgi:non-homologous end joining protein Ku
LIDPEGIDDLKLEAKHTIDMGRFVDGAEIDSRYIMSAVGRLSKPRAC